MSDFGDQWTKRKTVRGNGLLIFSMKKNQYATICPTDSNSVHPCGCNFSFSYCDMRQQSTLAPTFSDTHTLPPTSELALHCCPTCICGKSFLLVPLLEKSQLPQTKATVYQVSVLQASLLSELETCRPCVNFTSLRSLNIKQ